MCYDGGVFGAGKKHTSVGKVAMKGLRRVASYIQRHWDFILLDMVTFYFAYSVAIQVRRLLSIVIYHDELFSRFGSVAMAIYFAVLLITYNLDGVIFRGAARELRAVIKQMTLTWSLYTVVLFLNKGAFDYSRALYVLAFVSCLGCIFIARVLWRSLVKYTILYKKMLPHFIIVCEASRAQAVLGRVLPGFYEREYDIVGVVTNSTGRVAYNDHFPLVVGLDRLAGIIEDSRVQDAYVELDDKREEAIVIEELLQAGVAVHRSLRDSRLEYAVQYLSELSNRSVVTIKGTRISWVNKASHIWRTFKRWVRSRGN